jgi:hypothetical protein
VDGKLGLSSRSGRTLIRVEVQYDMPTRVTFICVFLRNSKTQNEDPKDMSLIRGDDS